MKITAQVFVLLLSFCTFSFQLSSATLQEFTKTIKKDFDITADGNTSISNKHGKVEINTWNQNKVKIEVLIKVETSKEANAQKALDAIDIQFSNSANSVSAETVFDKILDNFWSNNNQAKLSVDYVVYLPATNNLELRHKHGHASIDDMTAKVMIEFRHGEFRAGQLGSEAKIDMAHSNGSFSSTGPLKASVSHGKLSAETTGEADLDIRHATFQLRTGGLVSSTSGHSHLLLGDITGFETHSSSHDRIQIKTAEMVQVNGSHTTMKIEKASKVLNLDMSHGGCSVGLGNDFSEVNLVGSHTSFGVDIASGAAFKMEASTEYGGLSYPNGMDVQYHVEKNNSKTIKGSLGGSNSNSLLKARLSHGSLKVNQM